MHRSIANKQLQNAEGGSPQHHKNQECEPSTVSVQSVPYRSCTSLCDALVQQCGVCPLRVCQEEMQDGARLFKKLQWRTTTQPEYPGTAKGKLILQKQCCCGTERNVVCVRRVARAQVLVFCAPRPESLACGVSGIGLHHIHFVNRTPTHTAYTDAHSVSAHRTAQSDHFFITRTCVAQV